MHERARHNIREKKKRDGESDKIILSIKQCLPKITFHIICTNIHCHCPLPVLSSIWPLDSYVHFLVSHRVDCCADERAIDGSTYNYYAAIFTKLRPCMVQHNIGKLHV